MLIFRPDRRQFEAFFLAVTWRPSSVSGPTVALWLAAWCLSFLNCAGSLCPGTRYALGSAPKPGTRPRWRSEVKRTASFVSPKTPPAPPPRTPRPRPKWVCEVRRRTSMMSSVCAETPPTQPPFSLFFSNTCMFEVSWASNQSRAAGEPDRVLLTENISSNEPLTFICSLYLFFQNKTRFCSEFSRVSFLFVHEHSPGEGLVCCGSAHVMCDSWAPPSGV